MITTVKEFKKEYKTGIIVNYDKRTVIKSRSKNDRVEQIHESVEYPYIQAYQKGIHPTSILFIIHNGVIKRLVRANKTDPNSRYRKIDVSDLISNDICNDPEFNKKGHPAVVVYEGLLKIEE